MQLRNALIIAGALALGGIGPLSAQVLPQPGPPVPFACAYNASPVTLIDGQAGWVQCSNTGSLLVLSTPSGTQNVNITQVQGAAPSLTNPLWFTPATGATFPSTLPTAGTVAAGNGVVAVPSAETAAGITPVVSAALESNHVIKASAGNFYSGYITTGATAGWLLLANSASAPTAAGAAIAPLACVLAPANQTTSISAPGNIPMIFSTGITMVFSTSGCLTNTASATAFFSGLGK